jgi:hypothetical protein
VFADAVERGEYVQAEEVLFLELDMEVGISRWSGHWSSSRVWTALPGALGARSTDVVRESQPERSPRLDAGDPGLGGGGRTRSQRRTSVEFVGESLPRVLRL